MPGTVGLPEAPRTMKMGIAAALLRDGGGGRRVLEGVGEEASRRSAGGHREERVACRDVREIGGLARGAGRTHADCKILHRLNDGRRGVTDQVIGTARRDPE